MSAYAPVDDMDGKSPAEVLRELAWTRRQRNDGIAAREAHAKARGEAEHRRSKAERALADARRSFRGALDALNSTRTITTAAELDALRFQSVVLDAYDTPYVCERHATDGTRNEWRPSGMDHLDESEAILYHGPVTVLYEGNR